MFSKFDQIAAALKHKRTAFSAQWASLDTMALCRHAKDRDDYISYILGGLGRTMGLFLREQGVGEITTRDCFRRNAREYTLKMVAMSPAEYDKLVLDLRAAALEEMGDAVNRAYKNGHDQATQLMKDRLVRNLLG